MIYLTLPELLHIAMRALSSEPDVRDYGLLESALARPQATAFGVGAYRGLDAKAAALSQLTCGPPQESAPVKRDSCPGGGSPFMDAPGGCAIFGERSRAERM
jgi:hypothetical protein